MYVPNKMEENICRDIPIEYIGKYFFWTAALLTEIETYLQPMFFVAFLTVQTWITFC